MKRSRRNTNERGQVIILTVLIMSVMFVVGAITIDLTLYLSERRGAQTDADLAALAGAFELLDPAATSGDAIDAATDNIDANNDNNNTSLANPIVVDNNCYGPNDDADDNEVIVNVRHQSRALFLDIFGVTSPNIGAHAKACVGAAQAPGDVVPIQIDDNPGPCFNDDETPKFTAFCPIELGAQGGSSSRGMLDLYTETDHCSDQQGPANIEDMIRDGASGICLIDPAATCAGQEWYDCVEVQNGNPQNVLDGVGARLARDGLCDPDGDGTDQFEDTVSVVFEDPADPFKSIYEALDCDTVTPGMQKSPRIVTIIILEEEPPNGGGTFPIVAFAAFYIAGCAHEDTVVVDESDLDVDCTSPGPGAARIVPPRDVYISGPGISRLGHCGPPPNRGHGNNPTCPPTPTPSPTPTPTPSPPPTPTPAPTSAPTPTPSTTPAPGEPCGAPGRCVVYGRFVYLIESGTGTGPPTDQTTLFGISLVE